MYGAINQHMSAQTWLYVLMKQFLYIFTLCVKILPNIISNLLRAMWQFFTPLGFRNLTLEISVFINHLVYTVLNVLGKFSRAPSLV